MAEAQNLQPAQVLANLFGVSVRRIEQLKSEGIIKGEGRPTRYDLLPTIRAYIKYLSDKANGREKKQTVAKQEEEKLRAEVRLKKAKAKTAELELSELQGQMHCAEDVEAVMTAHVLQVRSMLMAMPGKLAVDLAALTTPAQAASRIREEVYYILEHLSEAEYNADEFRGRVMERQGWQSSQESAEGNDE